ncbi:AAA family ATPase [Jeotgalicoccus psychrophilus]|uniref:AAA family ATPase n=1 Tax=Jeotgalicoccus psychrophilus TaxID=157228 RepID=UPI00042A399D|nr:AAA family ATPase [Jeotgalicoccus psychrophilus]
MNNERRFTEWLKNNNVANVNDIVQYLKFVNRKYNSDSDEQVDFFRNPDLFKEYQNKDILKNIFKNEIKDLNVGYKDEVLSSLLLLLDQNNAASLYYGFILESNLSEESKKDKTEESDHQDISFDYDSCIEGGINKIFYGAPGTGKSYKVNEKFSDYNRITFHPEITYFDFIGGLRPIQNDDTGSINYNFAPGTFVDTLISALKSPEKKHGLIIEELNRANTAAVFGDVFQLLDRDDKGLSIYPILNKDISKYIFEKTGYDITKIRIPSNMSIIATMNSADQGVYVLDSAFKRRWEFEYLPINFANNELSDVEVAGFDIPWQVLGEELNNHLSEILKIDEDKLIGQRFLTKYEMQNIDTVSSKLLMYLWDDVVRYNREQVFVESNSFAKLITLFKAKGLACFVPGITSRIKSVDISEVDEISE